MGATPKGFPLRDDLTVADGVVIRRHDQVAPEAVEWIHAFLGRVAATSFPAPVPAPYFDGASVAVIDELQELVDELSRIGHADRSRRVIHGDMTAHNVLARGRRRDPCGAIDFMNAYVEVPLFDLGCALWRTGRPAQDAHEFDPHRIAAYVDGYGSVRPLCDEDRAAVVTYVLARGVQIVAKQRARGVVDHGPERRIDWLLRHRDRLVSVLIP